MVRWSSDPTQRAGLDGSRTGSRLGPQVRGLLDRLLGGSVRQAVPPPPRQEAASIAIASGKGGTGKSFLATNLAVLLHRAAKRCTLVDCDFGLGCDHLLLGLQPKLTLQDLVAGKATMRDVRQPTPAGPALVPGAQGVRHMAALHDQELLRLGQGLAEMALLDDVLLLDVGAGLAPQNVLTVLCADHVVLVTEPEIAALTDAYAVVKCATQLKQGVCFSVVVNRVTAPGQGAKTFDKLAEVSKRFTTCSLSYLGEIGFDPAVTQRRLGQLPIAVSDPDSDTTLALAAVLRKLEQGAGPLAARIVDPAQGIEARFREHRLFLS